MKIAIGQMNIAWESPGPNIERIKLFAEEAAEHGGDFLILPEMCTTGFSMNVEKIAETPDGPGAQALGAIAKEYGIWLLGGLSTKDAGDELGANSALIFDRKGRAAGRFDKLHLFELSGEGDHYRPGTAPAVFDIAGSAAAVFICYDLRFPEAFRAIAAKASLIFVLANWPAARQAHWETLLRARAIENQCFVVGANRVGSDGNGIKHAGGSMVFDPWGDLVARAGSEEELLIAELDPDEAARIRGEFPFLPPTPKRW